MRSQRAFSLVEIIITILLLGVLAVFTTMFFSSFVNGYLSERQAAESSLKAQVALDRMALELSLLNQAIAPVMSATSLQFTNTSGTSVTIAYAAGAITLNGNKLIDGLQSFSVSSASTGNGLGRSLFTVSFNILLDGVSVPFSTTVYPAN